MGMLDRGESDPPSQFIEAPDVRLRHIALSGIIMNGAHASKAYVPICAWRDCGEKFFGCGENQYAER